MPDYYFELRHHLDVAMDAARDALPGLSNELSLRTGREYPPLEEYELAGAERVVVAMGSTAGTTKDVVDELRATDEPVGLVRIVSFRPFPAAELRTALADAHDVFVLDRAASPGAAAPLFAEVAAALYGANAKLHSHVYGLGGRDLGPDGLRELFAGDAPAYIGLRSVPCPA
jgi:pyruvate ferredoxin oxidoreductase alpha subunit